MRQENAGAHLQIMNLLSAGPTHYINDVPNYSGIQYSTWNIKEKLFGKQ